MGNSLCQQMGDTPVRKRSRGVSEMLPSGLIDNQRLIPRQARKVFGRVRLRAEHEGAKHEQREHFHRGGKP